MMLPYARQQEDRFTDGGFYWGQACGCMRFKGITTKHYGWIALYYGIDDHFGSDSEFLCLVSFSFITQMCMRSLVRWWR